jgi:hypothetical protein
MQIVQDLISFLVVGIPYTPAAFLLSPLPVLGLEAAPFILPRFLLP